MNQDFEIVVLGSSPTGLYALREAALCGMRVALLDVSRGCAFYSRYASRSQVIHAKDLVGWVNKNLSGNRALILVPTSDVWIEAVMNAMPALRGNVLTFDAYQDIAASLLNKLRFHALCRKHGVETPGVWQAEGSNELRALSESVPFPCILKPALVHRARAYLRGRKVLLARTQKEFLLHVDGMPEGLGGWLVQEIVPGKESEITLFGGYIGRDGVPMQVFTGRKLRQYPAGFGSASLVVNTACDKTLELTLEFLKKIDFKGICGAEYKRDPRDGRLKMIEINPRPTLWFQASNDAGCRIVEAACRDMAHQEPLVAPKVKDVRWRYLFKDLASKEFYKRSDDFIFPSPDVSVAQSSSRRSWPVFRLSDPVPSLIEPFGFLQKAFERRR